MNSLGVRSILTALGVTIVSLLSPSLTVAAPSCGSIFSEAEAFSSVTVAIRELNRTHANFKQDMAKAGASQVEKTEALVGLRKVEQVSEAYLKTAGIKYEIQDAVFSVKDSVPEVLKQAPYKIFKITEITSKDETALMLQGALKNPKLKDLEIIFDPGLFFERPTTLGYFQQSKNRIVLSYGAFTWRSYGVADTIRHEVQHAFEYQKIKEGKPSLAQFIFSQGRRLEDPYGDHFRLDEVETHLRDLRFMTGRISNRQMKKNPHPAGEAAILELRLKKTYELIDRIRSFSLRAHVLLAEITNKNSYDRFENKKQGTTDWMFVGLKNDFFPTVTFTHKTGMDSSKEIKARLLWAEQRLNQISSEVDRIERTLPPR